ncbi:MAG: branched-chain amino acid ABC transporter permease [Clostridiales bacterium]|nr:branched-chain amino acid ABC transporter permease [Clostridiales bacterium]
MNKRLSEKYTLLGSNPKTKNNLLEGVKSFAKSPSIHFLLFGLIIVLIAYLAVEKTFPNIIPYSWASALSVTMAYSVASIGFCLLMGYSGLASLGTGGFIGIGTYAVYYIINVSGLSLWLAILVAIAVAIIIGAIVGFISLRIEGIYLVILTLGLSEILRNLYVVIEDSIKIKNFEFVGFLFKRQHAIYIVMGLLVIVMIITHNIINSPTGRAMLAMKNSTAAAQAMGISLIKYRLLAFIICTVYAALSGVLLMVTLRSARASEGTGFYALITSLNILAAVIIGGYKSIWGAIFGTFVLYGLKTTILSNIDFLSDELMVFISGILVIVIVMFYPGGLAQLIGGLKYKIKKFALKLREAKYGKDLG